MSRSRPRALARAGRRRARSRPGSPRSSRARARRRPRARRRRRSAWRGARSRPGRASPRRSSSGVDAGDAERDVGRALPEGPAERVADDHADVPAGALAQALPDPRGRRVGVDREEHERSRAPSRSRRRPRPRRRRSRAASRRSRAAGGRGRRRALSRRIASTWRGSRSPASSRARSDGSMLVEPHHAPLRLRDDLLRDDDDVGVLEPSCTVGCVREQRRRDRRPLRPPGCPRAAKTRSSVAHVRPVRRRPACAL